MSLGGGKNVFIGADYDGIKAPPHGLERFDRLGPCTRIFKANYKENTVGTCSSTIWRALSKSTCPDRYDYESAGGNRRWESNT
jgi:microsomal dipeptidase-like Zn-dependent dipeptidase